jgi:hypothetical protein
VGVIGEKRWVEKGDNGLVLKFTVADAVLVAFFTELHIKN